MAIGVIDIVGKLNAGDFVTIINIVNNIRLLIEPKVKKSIYTLELLLKAKQNMKKKLSVLKFCHFHWFCRHQCDSALSEYLEMKNFLKEIRNHAN